jgi:hypothetical protein
LLVLCRPFHPSQPSLPAWSPLSAERMLHFITLSAGAPFPPLSPHLLLSQVVVTHQPKTDSSHASSSSSFFPPRSVSLTLIASRPLLLTLHSRLYIGIGVLCLLILLVLSAVYYNCVIPWRARLTKALEETQGPSESLAQGLARWSFFQVQGAEKTKEATIFEKWIASEETKEEQQDEEEGGGRGHEEEAIVSEEVVVFTEESCFDIERGEAA